MGRAGRHLDREIALLAIPTLATLLAEPLYVLTDTAVVGHLGTAELGGLAIASTVILTGYALFVFLAYGTTASVARLIGAGNQPEAARQALQSMWLAGIIGLGLMIGGLVFGPALLGLLGGSGAVLENGWIYLRISLPGVPALMLTLAGTGYLRGMQNTRMPLVATLVGVVLNLVIEVVLIFGLGFGISASAASSVVAQWVVAGAYVWVVADGTRLHGAPLGADLLAIRSLLAVGGELLMRTVALRSALLVATAVAARMGQVSLAAHQVAFEIWNFLAMGIDSIAIAAQAMIGRLLGASDPAGARRAASRMMQWGLGAGLVAATVLVLVRNLIPQVFTSDERVVSVAASLMLWVAVLQPINAMAFVLDGILIGAGDTRYLAWAMALAAAVFIPLAVGVGLMSLDVEWLWACLGVLMAVRAATLGRRYSSANWAT